MTAPPISAPSPQEFWDTEVALMPDTAADWLLSGFVARGNMTLLTSMWKAGKTTLLAHLLARRASRARRFFCLSRHADTPRHFNFELNADGADYTVLPETDDDGFNEHWDVLRMVLEDAPQKLTRLDILDEWPDDFPKPDATTLWRWLESAVTAGLAKVEGTGHKADPFRYWVADAEARWRENPLYDHLEQQLRDLKLPFVSLREQRRELNDPHSVNG